MQSKLNWSILNTSWHSFLEWLGEHWWGSVREQQVISFMESTSRPGSIAVTAHFGDVPGGVCSVTVKTEDTVWTFHIFICKGNYKCTQLVQGGFKHPIVIIRQTFRELGKGVLLPKPRTIFRNPNYFSVTHIVEDMCVT